MAGPAIGDWISCHIAGVHVSQLALGVRRVGTGMAIKVASGRLVECNNFWVVMPPA